MDYNPSYGLTYKRAEPNAIPSGFAPGPIGLIPCGLTDVGIYSFVIKGSVLFIGSVVIRFGNTFKSTLQSVSTGYTPPTS